MNFWQSVILGIIQGATEFLPVSSSGHLILFGKLFMLNNTLFYDVMLHFGTLFAVVVMYRRSLVQLFTRDNGKKLLLLILASIPTFAIAFLAKLFVSEELLTALLPLGFALTIILIILNHFLAKSDKDLTKSYTPAIVCGIVQGIAVLPGLSRSGSTISTLGLFGVKKDQTAEFSFLLSIPVILASVAVEGYTAVQSSLDVNWLYVLTGVVVAAVTGMLAIKLVQKLLKQNNFIYFALYLFIPLLLSLLIL